VAAGLQACSAHRQIARSQVCAKTSVTRMAERLGRHALLLQSRAIAALSPLREAVVHDHFESFLSRQDNALGIGTPIGSLSWFSFGPDPAPHRGAGRRPDRPQLKVRYESSPYVASIERTLDLLVPLVPAGSQITLVVDGRKDYELARRRHPHGALFRFEVHRNPKRGPKGSPRSAAAIARDRAMSAADHLHQLERHSGAEHKRETIAFGRRLESALGRAFLFAVWRNFIKRRSEKKPDRPTPAMQVGLTRQRWDWKRALSCRLFPSKGTVPDPWRTLYRKGWTAGAPVFKRRHSF